MNKNIIFKIILLIVIVTLFIIAFPYVSEYASLDYIKTKQNDFVNYYQDNRTFVLIAYFIAYVIVTALSLPGAAIMTLLAGALFGLFIGTVLVSFASSLGATLSFMVVRFLFGQSLQQKYGDKLTKINEGIKKEGAFYLFAMRLVPAFPFFLVNLLMALSTLPVLTFYWVSQLGMLAGTIAFVYAGTELAKINNLQDLLSPTLIAAFVIIGVLPIIAKKIVAWWRQKS